MIIKNFTLLKDTKTCYRFECHEGSSFTTLYLKKDELAEAGIDATKGITVTIAEAEED